MSRRDGLILAAALVLLAGMGVQSALRPGPGDAEPFHRAVVAALDTMPRQIGDWSGTDEPATRAAEALLKPNVLIQRTFRNVETGDWATLLLVQTKDAGDMNGHYPPVCYPAHGWLQQARKPIDLRVDGMTIPATQYTFELTSVDGTASMNVINFMIMPGGEILRGIEGVARAAADYTRYFHGAAQVQIVTPGDWSNAERMPVVKELLGANLEMIRLLHSGQAPDETRATTPPDTP